MDDQMYIVIYVGALLGVVLATVLPYLQKWWESGKTLKFNFVYIVSGAVSGAISSSVLVDIIAYVETEILGRGLELSTLTLFLIALGLGLGWNMGINRLFKVKAKHKEIKGDSVEFTATSEGTWTPVEPEEEG